MGLQATTNILVFSSRPAMIAMFSEKTFDRGLSIENLSTSLRIGKDGQREFVIDALVSSPTSFETENLDACIAYLSSLEDELQLSHFDIRVHTA